MADLLWETTLTDEQKKFVETIRSSSENLLQLINDIIDLSKVEAGQIKLERSPFNLRDVVNKACENQALRAREKGLKLKCQVGSEVEMFILGDSIRLHQILSNLIENAVKFTEEGEVFVEVRRQGFQGQTMAENGGSGLQQYPVRTTELLFSVTDTGIGIPSEKTEVIFDRFSQADSSTTRKYGGTGLGLAISHRLAKLMEGRMWVESEVGQGSTFFFTAKFGVQSEAEHVKAPGTTDLEKPMVS
jgi:signal transduction histidine kinase